MTDVASSFNSAEPVQLSEEEAEQLAQELKLQLRQGERPAGDAEAIEKMVAGLGDRRGLLRLTFAESLGTVGSAAVPALCSAMCEHENVTVRRAAARALRTVPRDTLCPGRRGKGRAGRRGMQHPCRHGTQLRQLRSRTARERYRPS